MAATVKPLGLYDLLAPQLGLGFQFPSFIDQYLSLLAVADFTTTSDPNSVLYTGTVYFPSAPGQPPVLQQHHDPSGAVFDFHDISFQFRLLLPRAGSDELQMRLGEISGTPLPFPPSLQPIEDGVFGLPSSPPTGPTDYPGIAFQLELLLTVLTFHMGPNWEPAVMNSDGSVSANPGSPANTDVRILMPQVLMRYTQAQDFTQSPEFRVDSWGNPGFDAPNDLAEGQLATMDPPLAIHSSGRVAFGVQTIILDLSTNNTPPEILQYFGTDQSFQGVYAKAIQVYYCDSNKDFALNFLVRDVLVSFKGEVWLEAEVDLIFDAFGVNVTAWFGSASVPVNAGSQINPTTWSGGSVTMPSGGVMYLQVAGGVPPYTQSVIFTPTGGTATPNLWDSTMAQFPASSTTQQGTLAITITDSSVPPQKYQNTMNCILAADTDDNPVADAPAPPQAPSNAKPSFIRRLSIQLHIEQNEFTLAELSGEIDIDAAARASTGPAASPGNDLALVGTSTPAATASSSPVSGIIDFSITVTYDMATGTVVDTFTLGAAPADINGLYTWNNSSDNVLVDILGAILIFTPIINAATQAIDPSLAGQWEEIAVDLGVPIAIGATGLVKTTSITLHGGSLTIRDNIPAGKITNASITFDYGVNFHIPLTALGIQLTQPPVKPMSVRYQAVGVSALFGPPPKCAVQIVLDTSKGYSLNLSDPGLFNLAGPLGDILKIAAVRIARFNPLTIEIDIEVKADLGIITVNKFMVKVPLDPPGIPSITPSAISVNIPETIIGSGSFSINQGGFEGSIDLTLCDLGLRIMAQVGVQSLTSGQRKVTAFFLGFEIDFPAPIMLGDTGLSLFGIFGLFGMHYDRLLQPPIPGDAVGPDLRWLLYTGGNPNLLESETDPTKQYWGPKIDNWAFGLGAILGTSDGILITMRGMLILELPGPRILITVNLKFVVPLPGLIPGMMDTAELDVGIIGILDLDFGAGQITLAVMIAFQIQDLISVQIPVQLFFNWNDPADWHFWIGTIQTPASASILGIVKGSGYFMLGGQAIKPFPPNTSGSLPGVAVAMGIAASIVWGGQSSSIYLKVAAEADFGVSFSPTLFIVGSVHLEGALHLVVVDISVTGDFALKAPNPVYLNVHVCGKVSFFFFHINACVNFTLGSDQSPVAPPPLVTNFYLQSFAPVIAMGQADRPIDASLGNAQQVGAPANQPMPVVPIDSVPVIQMQYGVDATSATTFTQSLPACPTYPGSPGVNLGGNRFASYQVTSLTISPALPGNYQPPVAWRPNKPSSNTSETGVDLALFTRTPNVATSALERSSQLTSSLEATWSQTCEPVAPAACVFWCFCKQLTGPSLNGWTVTGIPSADPPSTTRRAPVPVTMTVMQPALSASDATLVSLGIPLTGQGLQPAQIIGPSFSLRGCQQAIELPELLTMSITSSIQSGFPTPPSKLGTTATSVFGTAAKSAALVIGASRWLQFEMGASNRIRIFLAINTALYQQSKTAANATWVAVNERSSTGALVASHSLTSLNPTVVTGVASLPATWTAAGPWQADSASIFTFLDTLPGVTLLLVDFVPKSTTTTVGINVSAPSAGIPSLVVGAIESCPVAETNRYQTGIAVQKSTTQAITSYLDGGASVPLLAPGTTYTVTVTYNVAITDAANGNSTVPSTSQAFQFQTDNQPPAALDPWVLCSCPAQSDQFVFYEDQVQVVFNDTSVFSIFEGYGYQLNMNLSAADGLPEGSPGGGPLTGSPSPLEPFNGVGPAGYDSMLGIAKKMKCIGSVSEYQNQRYTAPVYLRPLMGYTFDLVADPAPPVASPGMPDTPLFRRSFATGRYANMQALAADLGGSVVTHRALQNPLTFPAGTPFSSPSNESQVVMDADIQQAFVNSGEQALPAPSGNSIVMYWLKNASGQYVPHAILLDSIEPLWRYRSEPTFANPVPSDTSFEVVTISPVPALEVTEVPQAGKTSFGTFVVSPGGARTVAMFATNFSPPAAGATVSLQLLRPASATYGSAAESAGIFQMTVMPQAPWEYDNV